MRSKMHKHSLLLVALCLLISLSGCSFKSDSFGEFNEIVVIAEEGDWQETEGLVKEVFERPLRTPQPETFFYVHHQPADRFETLKKRRLILLLGSLESEGEVGDLIQRMVGTTVRPGIESGEHYVFLLEEEWARNQVMMVVLGATLEDLKEKITENSDQLFNTLYNRSIKYYTNVLYSIDEKEDLSKRMYEDYKFSLKLMNYYQVADESKDDNFIWFRTKNPDRMVFVHWIDTTDVYVPDKEWVLQERDRITNKLMDGMVIYPETAESKIVQFKDYLAVQTRANWWQPDEHIGGPMVNYSFFDEETSRIYMVDYSVFAPDYPSQKEPFLRQLEAVVNTFSTSEPYK
ncbi:MAG: DUF4837 family protein [bacterium]|nr:DUF4837 family protein [bacterium]